jgi:hypothetical protein
MAEHGSLEYATATGNDYPAHENTYHRFLHFTFTAVFHLVNLLLGLTVGGVVGDWGWALFMFAVAVIGAVAGLLSGSRTPSYVAFVICALIWLYKALAA